MGVEGLRVETVNMDDWDKGWGIASVDAAKIMGIREDASDGIRKYLSLYESINFSEAASTGIIIGSLCPSVTGACLRT